MISKIIKIIVAVTIIATAASTIDFKAIKSYLKKQSNMAKVLNLTIKYNVKPQGVEA